MPAGKTRRSPGPVRMRIQASDEASGSQLECGETRVIAQGACVPRMSKYPAPSRIKRISSSSCICLVQKILNIGSACLFTNSLLEEDFQPSLVVIAQTSLRDIDHVSILVGLFLCNLVDRLSRLELVPPPLTPAINLPAPSYRPCRPE